MAFGDSNEYLGITENTLYVLNDQSGYTSESSNDDSPQNIIIVNKNNKIPKNKKLEQFERWTLEFSDDLWYMWSMINEFRDVNVLPIFCKIDYASFCNLVYENS